MTKKTLGFIGKGRVLSHFLEYVGSNSLRRDVLFDEIDKILFYNYGYDTGEDFKTSSSYGSIVKTIEHLLEDSSFNVTIDVKGSPKNITDFFSGCDVIVDISEGYISGQLSNRAKGAREGSLCAYALGLFKREDVSTISISARLDFRFYQKEMRERERNGEKGRIVLSESDFKTKWELSRDVLQAVNTVHQKFPLGERSFMLFPFSAPMLVERGKQFADALMKGNKVLPTYLTIVNEPCLASLVVSSSCPEMREYMVGCTGYDVIRLEDCLNAKYAAEKEKAGFKEHHLSVTLRGFHDKEVMVPVLYPLYEKDREVFGKVFEHVDYHLVHQFMKEQVGNYFFTHTDRELTSLQVDESLFGTIVPALQSRGKALSVFPARKDERTGKDGRALCNGIFQEKYDDGSGLFLVGDHRFRNGKVMREEYGL